MRKKAEEPYYKALVTLWTTDDQGQERQMEPGEIGKFAHLAPENIERLISKGAIELYTGELPADPVVPAEGEAPLDQLTEA